MDFNSQCNIEHLGHTFIRRIVFPEFIFKDSSLAYFRKTEYRRFYTCIKCKTKISLYRSDEYKRFIVIKMLNTPIYGTIYGNNELNLSCSEVIIKQLLE